MEAPRECKIKGMQRANEGTHAVLLLPDKEYLLNHSKESKNIDKLRSNFII